MKTKKSQHEIAGFVLIVVLVTIIGLVFLMIFANRGGTGKRDSIEISNLLEASMYYTTDCAISYIPNYENLQDLIKTCYNDPNQNCVAGKKCYIEKSDDKFEKRFSVTGKQGPWRHVSWFSGEGSASEPTLLKAGLVGGDKIYVNDITGVIQYETNDVNCREGSGYGFSLKGGFYDENYRLIKEFNLKDAERGIITPSSATRLYAYIIESENDKNDYQKHGGICLFDVEITQEVETEVCVDDTAVSRNVCDLAEDSLRTLISQSLNVHEDSPNKAYNLRVYYTELADDSYTEEIININEGTFMNCTSIPGGLHTISATLFSSGNINIELEVCRG